MPQAAPFGGWRSPITAASVAAGETPLGKPEIVGQDVYWLEGKPREGGRAVIVHQAADGRRRELTPTAFYVRTRVHEYGGGAYFVHGDSVYFSNFVDQRLYRQNGGAAPRAITPEPPTPAAVRYADGLATTDGRLIVCVRESHPSAGGEAVNDLVVLPSDGSAPPRSIASGHDFFSSPRISPDGRNLAWLTWDHPRMPWDGSELWVADFGPDGSLGEPVCVAGGVEESLFQPEWSPAGELHFVSDRSGWWNLYRLEGTNGVPLAPMEAEFGTPQWQFGMATYAFLADGRIACIYSQSGVDHLGFVLPGGGFQPADLSYTSIAPLLRSSGNTLVFIAGSATEAAAVIRMDAASGQREVLRRSVEHALEPAYVSQAQPIAFPSRSGEAYALYYPPTNPEYTGMEGERPPLIVESHGGPTSMARAQLAMETQFWTSRGFAVVDVNYGGSSGFGRAYRARLNGRWGIVDTEDCINAAKYLADQRLADGARLTIRGGSAGGYTTLCALVFHDDFAAGASYFGVADCEALAKDTHKFESRYLDGLIGPYPAARDVYVARSPIHFASHLSCPVILFQGLEDRVVPPSQAEMMVAALRDKALPFAYLAFEGEQHGFRKAETIQRTLEAEWYFYSRVLGFPLAEKVEPVEIENLPRR
jgi:dipeptidyl aminopeptidase/acylaminoacyl peptidase